MPQRTSTVDASLVRHVADSLGLILYFKISGVVVGLKPQFAGRLRGPVSRIWRVEVFEAVDDCSTQRSRWERSSAGAPKNDGGGKQSLPRGVYDPLTWERLAFSHYASSWAESLAFCVQARENRITCNYHEPAGIAVSRADRGDARNTASIQKASTRPHNFVDTTNFRCQNEYLRADFPCPDQQYLRGTRAGSASGACAISVIPSRKNCDRAEGPDGASLHAISATYWRRQGERRPNLPKEEASAIGENFLREKKQI